MNGIGGDRYCMLCGRKGDHWSADCPMRRVENRGPAALPLMRRKTAPKRKP